MSLTKVSYSMITGAVANVKDFGAKGDGLTDDGAAIAAAMAASKSVFFPAGIYLSSQTLTMTDGQELYGSSRWDSKLKFVGNINGLKISTQCSVNNMRIIGNASMGADKTCVDFGKTQDAYRSNIRNCIIGGESASLGDPGNIRCGGSGIAGGYSTFLISFENVYFFNANVGYENPQTGTQVNNAVRFAGCEFHACKIGCRIVTLNGVLFSQCTFEGNDENGLIIGDSRSAVLVGCYFEANHLNSSAPVKSDCYIGIANNMTGFGTQPGKGITIKDVFLFKGGTTEYGIYVEGQSNINIDGAFFGGYATDPVIYIAGNANDYGRIANTYTASAGPISINNNVPFILENNVRSGLENKGWSRAVKNYTAEGVTASVNAGENTIIFTPGVGEMYLVTASNSTGANDVTAIGLVQGCTSGNHLLTTLANTGAAFSIGSGTVRLNNNLGGAATFAWTILRIQ